MTWKQGLPLGIGVVLVAVALGIVGAAMFLSDKGEEAVHLYQDIQQTGQPNPMPSNLMELQGKWQGMVLAPLDSPTAMTLPVGEAENGVVVAGLSPLDTRAQSAGLTPGDVIVGVDQKPVRDLADVYTASRALNPLQPTLLDIQRHGQPLTLVLPAASAVALPSTREAPNAGVSNNLGGGAPSGPVPVGWPAGHAYCPRDGLVVPMASISPSFMCPRCRGPMMQYPAATP